GLQINIAIPFSWDDEQHTTFRKVLSKSTLGISDEDITTDMDLGRDLLYGSTWNQRSVFIVTLEPRSVGRITQIKGKCAKIKRAADRFQSLYDLATIRLEPQFSEQTTIYFIDTFLQR